MLKTSNSLSKRDEPHEFVDDSSWHGLIAECLAGNRTAQEQLYERCHQRVYRLALRMVGLRDAADVLQQAFLQVFRKLDQFHEESRFETWLFRVTMNEALQHLRRQRRWQCSSLESDCMDHEPNQENEFDDKELLEQALARLEPELRSLFLLREVEKLSYAEIAEVTQTTEGTVASRLNRARQLLKQFLIELGWEP